MKLLHIDSSAREGAASSLAAALEQIGHAVAELATNFLIEEKRRIA